MNKRRLNSAQRTVVGKIQQLFRHREALNITAIKRNHPDLIEKVYSIKPFWGWKQALEDSGLDYSRIRIELDEFCQCHLCGENRRALTRHLLRIHEVQPEEYRERFPGAELFSEELLARIKSLEGKKRQAILPDWEPLWSPEYVLDRIHALHRKGISLNFKSMNLQDCSLARKSIQFFGNWDSALTKVGLNPRQIRRMRPVKRWTPEMVTKELRTRKRKGLPLNPTAVHGERIGLHYAAVSRYGSYARALQTAGINPKEVLKPAYTHADRQRLLDEVRKMGTVAGPGRKAAVLAFHERYIGVATKFFGSNWAKVAQAAGVDYGRLVINRQRDFSTPERVLEELRKRIRMGQEITSTAVASTDRALYRAAKRHFGEFYASYPHLGLDKPELQNEPRYTTRKEVVAAIRQRLENHRPLNLGALIRGKDRDGTLGKKGIKFFGCWDNALRTAGVDPREIRALARIAHKSVTKTTIRSSTHFAKRAGRRK